ncbi:MAG: methyltransferase domain-containing protein [Myxococcales bacterium]|nr:methyltransferase domain-containing protein [Myxococcales bacterium]
MAETAQLDAWTGAFGDEYIERCTASEEAIRTRARAWVDMMRPIEAAIPKSILEVGCNIGINQRALRRIFDAELFAVEPNPKARGVVLADGVLDSEHLHAASALELPFEDHSMEMCFTSGVLIHISPDDLMQACSEMYRVSSRYILCAEYFSRNPEERTYRGQEGLLFKRDFGSFWLDNFELAHLGHGFHWRRTTGIDDVTWWLFEKKPTAH